MLLIIGAGLLAAASAYTWGLSKVRARYEPDNTHWAALFGFGLIEAAMLVACLMGELPIKAFWIMFAFSWIAAAPIFFWRERAKRTLRRKRTSANQRKQDD